ncbi:MAG: ROK family transcriptional regulator [Solirubrobacteraceae bacterium]
MSRDSIAPRRAGHNDIRRNNLEVVLRELSAGGPDSRAGIAARTGLTRATVSRLVAELIALGVVRETGRDGGGRAGRPSTRLELGEDVLAIGMEVNVDYVSVLVVDLAGREVLRDRRQFDAGVGPDRCIAALASLCRDARRALTRRRRHSAPILAGVTVAVPGLVDVAAGVVTEAPNLHWHDVAVADPLRRVLRLGATPVHVGNDANLAAVAEYRGGAWAGTPNLVYITGEVGIGGGIIVDGQPLLGTRGYGGEIGHMNVMRDGPLCGCGRRGCWEACIGLNALLQSARQRPRGDVPPERKIEPIVRRARGGDAATLALLEDLGRWIGVGAANLVNVFDPQVIILGGYFVELSDWILQPARQALEAGTLARTGDSLHLGTSTLGFAAAAQGGAIQAIERVMSDPTALLALV